MIETRPGERLPGSSEILESSFGKLKSLERDYQKAGLTSLLLSYAALLSKTTPEVVRKALKTTPTKRVFHWIKTKLGQTVKSKQVNANHAVNVTSSQQNPDSTHFHTRPIFQ